MSLLTMKTIKIKTYIFKIHKDLPNKEGLWEVEEQTSWEDPDANEARVKRLLPLQIPLPVSLPPYEV